MRLSRELSLLAVWILLMLSEMFRNEGSLVSLK